MDLNSLSDEELDAFIANERSALEKPATFQGDLNSLSDEELDAFIANEKSISAPPVSAPSSYETLQQDFDSRKQGDAGGALRALAYGISGGQIPFGNVITSGIGAGIAKAASPFTGDKSTYGQLYDQAQADTKATQEANLGATFAGNVTGALTTFPAAFSKGGVATTILGQALTNGVEKAGQYAGKVAGFSPLAGTGKLAEAGNLATRAAGRAALAAPVAGLYGAGDADSGSRGEGFTSGATLGAVASTALPVAFGAIGAVGGVVIKKTEEVLAKRALNNILKGAPIADDLSNTAVNKVIERLKADYPDPAQFNDVMNKFTYGNKSLAELGGERTINLAKGAAQYPSGESITKEKFLPRVGETVENIKNSLSRNITKKTDYYSTVEDVLEQGRAKAKPLYTEAFKANRSLSSRRLDNILNRPAARDALKAVAEDFQNKATLLAKPDPELTALAKELASLNLMEEVSGGVSGGLKLEALDAIKKSLDKKVKSAKRAMDTGNSDGGAFEGFESARAALVDEIDNLDRTGLYKKARATAGDYLSNEKAMELGTSYKKIDSPLIQRQMQKFTPSEKESFKVGVVKSIRDDIDRVADGGNVYQRVFGKPERRNQLMKVLGEKDYFKLEKELLNEDKVFRIRNEVLGGSPTTSKAVAAREFDEGVSGFATDAMTTGATSALLRQGVKFVKKQFDGLSDRTAGDVAKLLFETDRKEKTKLLNALRKTGEFPKDKISLLENMVKSANNARRGISYNQLQKDFDAKKTNPLRITVRPSDKGK